MCVIAVPLTFIQYFYTRERITEKRRATESEGEQLQIKEAGFGTQLKACVKDKYWIMFIILIFVYQVLNALKSVSQIYYAGWVVAGNAYGKAAAIQARFTMITMAPMGPMLFVVLPEEGAGLRHREPEVSGQAGKESRQKSGKESKAERIKRKSDRTGFR